MIGNETVHQYHMNGRQKGHSEVTPSHMKEKYTEADVVSGPSAIPKIHFHAERGQVSWSGCLDSQTSADTWEAGAAVGAMSYVCQLPVLDTSY